MLVSGRVGSTVFGRWISSCVRPLTLFLYFFWTCSLLVCFKGFVFFSIFLKCIAHCASNMSLYAFWFLIRFCQGGGFNDFMFTPIWGRFPVWLIFFKGLKPPTSCFLNKFVFVVLNPRLDLKSVLRPEQSLTTEPNFQFFRHGVEQTQKLT